MNALPEGEGTSLPPPLPPNLPEEPELGTLQALAKQGRETLHILFTLGTAWVVNGAVRQTGMADRPEIQVILFFSSIYAVITFVWGFGILTWTTCANSYRAMRKRTGKS